MGGVDVVLHSASLRRDGFEDWIAAVTEVSRREPLVLWNDALMCRCIEVVVGHKVGSTMLPTASTSSTAESERGRRSSALAVLLLTRVVLLVRNK